MSSIDSKIVAIAAATAAAAAAAVYVSKTTNTETIPDEPWYTATEAIPHMVKVVRDTFSTGLTEPFDFRKQQLHCLLRLVQENKSELCKAVKDDLSRHPKFTERVLGGCEFAIQHSIEMLETWAKPQSKAKDKNGSKMEIRHISRGTVLIINTWNFANPLALKPLASAIAAGNTAILKMSEVVRFHN